MAAGRLATLHGTPHVAQPDLAPISHFTSHAPARRRLHRPVDSGSRGGQWRRADWFDNGRVDKIYPLVCYPQAIKSLPPDLLIYGNAEEEIGRAWDFAKLGKPDPGSADPTPPTSTGTTGTDTTSTGTTGTDTTSTDTTGTDTTSTDTTTGTTTDTSGPSAVPIPVLVLGGLAVLLLAAGSAGYLRRRMNGDGDGDGDGTPPAAA
jgi:hypothetical protein